ncbi:hypothetical protein C453_17159 [Haloferax elongans ATCC BAA-1513]|uniref:Uncharacterized protein n=1 Tax=Haloferax elongans ATCC BAA-1513 TaxID=1230453 RepID=M0HB36_HALEO|nr:hypothetical protein [Haloferax elongans]ELZ81766.1 hypothetical protein C453_17159 [Haloferax elongans ATCC BAA-1513]
MTEQQDSLSEDSEPDTDSDTSPLNTISDKDIILNARHLVGPDAIVNDVHEALTDAGLISSGYENASRTFREARDGTYSDERINDALNDQIQTAIEPALLGIGNLANDTDAESCAAINEPASTADEIGSDNVAGTVRAEDVQTVKEKIELLHEESQALLDVDESVGARRAEFIGETAVKLLDKLLEE